MQWVNVIILILQLDIFSDVYIAHDVHYDKDIFHTYYTALIRRHLKE